MGLIFADSLSQYSNTTDMSRLWGIANSGWTWSSNAGRDGGPAIQTVTTAGNIATGGPTGSFAQAPGTLCGIGFWVKATATPSANLQLCRWIATNGALCNAIRVTTTGTLAMQNTQSTISFSGNTNICDGQWHWIEWYHQWPTNSGVHKLWLDTISQWNGTDGIGNGSSAITAQYIQFQSPAQGTWTIQYPFMVDNVSGAAPQPSGMPFGPMVISTLLPSADSSVQFAPDSGGTNYNRVNESGSADEDTSYVQDGTSGHADEYTYAALGFTPTSILSVQLTTRARNPGSGSINYKPRCHSGATTSDGTSTVASPTYVSGKRSLDTDPNTSAAWTPTNLASAKFGYTVV